mmetsp:Transcript_552/g.1127  ORF Transcript_552/g.1127 Transcript_552/m.1127 type:complete len:233 (+) Transcript_552:132-830(+)
MRSLRSRHALAATSSVGFGRPKAATDKWRIWCSAANSAGENNPSASALLHVSHGPASVRSPTARAVGVDAAAMAGLWTAWIITLSAVTRKSTCLTSATSNPSACRCSALPVSSSSRHRTPNCTAASHETPSRVASRTTRSRPAEGTLRRGARRDQRRSCSNSAGPSRPQRTRNALPRYDPQLQPSWQHVTAITPAREPGARECHALTEHRTASSSASPHRSAVPLTHALWDV